ncbi:MAG TPA: hypothetical protein VFC63_12140 [Blastocatellia bacterium]|nr:hypothetical protein [Blastocatellia bacterium]
MPKHYERVILEAEVKQRLEEARDKLRLSSLSATVIYLINNLPTDKGKPTSKPSG